MTRIVSVLAATLVCLLGMYGPVRALGPQDRPATPGPASPAGGPQRALLDRYCVGCHNQRAKTAGLMLDAMDVGTVGDHPEAWERGVRKLRGGLMPPSGMPRPDEATRDGFVSWLETELDAAAAAH